MIHPVWLRVLLAIACIFVGSCAASRAPVAREAPSLVAKQGGLVLGRADPPAPRFGCARAPGAQLGVQEDSARVPVTGAPMLGCPDALVTVVEFADFQCPFCSRVRDTLGQLQQRYGADVRIVWRNNPLPFHAHAQLAAEAAMEAYAQQGNEGFWRFHELLYNNQSSLERGDLERYAMQLQLDPSRFRAALDGHVHAGEIARDHALAESLGAQGTPNFFVNGTNLTGAQPLQRFAALIDTVLARARAVQPPSRAYAAAVADPYAEPASVGQPNAPPARPAPSGTLDPSTVYAVPLGRSPVRGPASALVTLVAFSDFQCPFCRRSEETLEQLRQRFPNDLRIVWRNNPLVFHPDAQLAAEAAMEAYAQRGAQGFWLFHDLLFANQPALSAADLERYAQSLQLDMNRFHRALAGHVHAQEVAGDLALGAQLAVQGTPTFFLNGRRLVGAQPLEAFTQLVNEVRASAEATLSANPGLNPAGLYERIVASGAVTPVYTTPPTPPTPPAQPDDDSRVYALRRNPRAPTQGGPNASVVLEWFADFQCPFCARVLPTLEQVVRHYGNRVRLVWRDYPLPFHTNAMLAAEAAREVLEQRGNVGFWQYHRLLFQNRESLERADLERYAQSLQVDMSRFRRALDTHAHEAEVRDDMAAANATGVSMGTPGFFLNGRHFAGAMPFEQFQRRIDAALAARGGR